MICVHTSNPSIPGIEISVNTNLNILEQHYADSRCLKQLTALAPLSNPKDSIVKSLSIALSVIKLNASSSQSSTSLVHRSLQTLLFKLTSFICT
jgi:hypothetical protein